mmetsp:Transcript_19401/g.42182  ORF Transcript_19401/g.42182 Transcript_19401/m.42182 type:complete len:219 (+) Transcript_19401:1073-1729(+)
MLLLGSSSNRHDLRITAEIDPSGPSHFKKWTRLIFDSRTKVVVLVVELVVVELLLVLELELLVLELELPLVLVGLLVVVLVPVMVQAPLILIVMIMILKMTLTISVVTQISAANPKTTIHLREVRHLRRSMTTIRLRERTMVRRFPFSTLRLRYRHRNFLDLHHQHHLAGGRNNPSRGKKRMVSRFPRIRSWNAKNEKSRSEIRICHNGQVAIIGRMM